jgi:hypothetical protein
VMERRGSVCGLLLVSLVAAERTAVAQYVERAARDYVSEDEAVIELGLPAGARLRDATTLSRRPPIFDDRIQRTQYDVNVQLDDSLPATVHGQLNATAPGCEPYVASGGFDRPTRIDYLFIGPSTVHAPPQGEVTMQEINLSHRIRIPFGDRASLRMQPLFGVTFLDGPGGHDPILPPQLYKVAADFEVGYRWSERLLLSAGVTPGVWSDFQEIDGADFRMPARAVAAYKWAEGIYVSAGVLWTDNYYGNILPIAGVIWDATDRWRFELVTPRARAVYRLHEELQFYGGAEIGGDTYLIRTDGIEEKFQYRDFRVFSGTEIATWDRASIFLESGYVFNRRFRLGIQEDRNIDNAFYVRLGMRF